MAPGFDYRICGFLPLSLVADGDRVAWALGWQPEGGHTFTVPLSDDGADPATFYGFSTAAQVGTKNLLEGGTLPAVAWEAFGLTEARATAVMIALGTRLAIAPSSVDPAAQFAGLISAAGLQRIEPSIP